MFKGSLKYNLDPKAEYQDDELIRLLKEAGLEKLLERDDKGLNLEISENGSNLSSGEK